MAEQRCPHCGHSLSEGVELTEEQLIAAEPSIGALEANYRAFQREELPPPPKPFDEGEWA